MVQKSKNLDFSLKGDFLVAMPLMDDERFFESVIYVVEHGAEGAMALIINQTLQDLRFEDVLRDLNVNAPDRKIEISSKIARRHVLRGGPVDRARGFVLHSPDYDSSNAALEVTKDIHLSANVEILQAIAYEEKPEKAIFALGYCGWSPGQLEQELAQNAWLTVPYDDALLFDVPLEARYEKALKILGVNRASLSAYSGNA